jgi:hypothetical protein
MSLMFWSPWTATIAKMQRYKIDIEDLPPHRTQLRKGGASNEVIVRQRFDTVAHTPGGVLSVAMVYYPPLHQGLSGLPSMVRYRKARVQAPQA